MWIWDFGLRIADLGMRIADCGFGSVDFYLQPTTCNLHPTTLVMGSDYGAVQVIRYFILLISMKFSVQFEHES